MKPHNKKSLLVALACCCAVLALCIGVSARTHAANEARHEAKHQTIATSHAPVSAQKKAQDAEKKAQEAHDKGARKADGVDEDTTSDKATEKTPGDAALTEVSSPGASSYDMRNANDQPIDVPVMDQDTPTPNEDVPAADDKALALGSDKSAASTDHAVIELADEPIFTIPEGAAYVPSEVLASVDEDMDNAQLAARLKDSGASTVDPDSASRITADTVRLSVMQGYTVEDAVNELLASGVTKGAQPDYVYYMEDIMPDQGELEIVQDDAPSTEEAVELGERAQDEEAEPVDEAPADEAPAAEAPTADAPVDDMSTDVEFELVGEGEEAEEEGEFAEEDALLPAQNDPVSDDPYSIFQWGLSSINAPQVWDLAEASPLSKVGVAVVDCGFDVDHEDLKNVIAPGSPYNAYRASRDITDAEQLADVTSGSESKQNGQFNHGMHVSGIIAAERNNGVGIAGVANNVQLVPIRAFNYAEVDFGVTSSSLIKSFEYCMDNREKYNIRVINCSIGTKRTSAIATDDKICAEIDKAYAQGIVTVCSVGNSGASGPYINYPSDWATAVSVINLKSNTYQRSSEKADGVTNYTGATWGDPADVLRSPTSNYNASGETTKDISAPGHEILSTTDATKTTVLGSEGLYMFDSGTSMAAPHVSGVLAMMFGKVDVDASYDGAQYMVDKLYESARHVKEDVPFELEYGHGEVNALAAWEALDNLFVDGPSYVALAQSGATYAIRSNAPAAGETTTGWSFSSSNADVLEVDAVTGVCTPKAVGEAEVLATKDGQTLTKRVNVVGPIKGYGVVMADTLARYSVEQPSTMAWEWSVSGDATISDTGVLVARETASKLTLSATLVVAKDSDDGITLTKDVYVLGVPAESASVYVGDTTTLSIDIPEGYNAPDDALVWGSLDEDIATVAGGVVTGVKKGEASIWVAPKEAVSIEEDGSYHVHNSMYRTITVTVKETIASASIKVASIGNKTYTGAAQTPKPVLTCNGATLVEGVDYTLSYANNVKVGTATITINGAGTYAGTSRKVTFKIVKAKISSAKVASIAKQAYTGKAIQPKPKLTYAGKTLKLGTDYALAYKNNKKAGTATVVVTGKGNFKGTKSVKFKIVAPSVTYRAYVQGKGWQAWKSNGKLSGTTGRSRRAEGLRMKATSLPVSGGITYSAHVQGVGWQAWKSDGATAGLPGKGKRVEAIKVKLTGKLAKKYDVYYRTHCQRIGWTKWVKNGAVAGTTGRSLRLEALEVKIVPKGTTVK